MAELTEEQKKQIPDPPTLRQSLARLNKDQLALLFKHRAFSTTLIKRDNSDDAAINDTINASSNTTGGQSGNVPLFEFPEHEWLGQQLRLKGHDTASTGTDANSNPFTLPNGLTLTHGQINGLAGDFFATAIPIYSATTDDKRRARFQTAYNALATGDPAKAKNLLVILEAQTLAVNNARKGIGGKTLKEVWAEIDLNSTGPLEAASQTGNDPGASYETLLETNLDHFKPNSRIAYDTGHAWALDVAKGGDLNTAYTIDAFAEHFLEDSFASGHLRVPRDHMWDSFVKNVCVNAMHNEDNLAGLLVNSALPESKDPWKVIGDTMLFEDDNDDGRNTGLRCLFALQASADEVYDAFTNHIVPAKEDYKAWSFAPTMTPTLETPESHNNGPPMFRLVNVDGNDEVWQRKGLNTNDPPPTDWEFEPVVGDMGSWLLPQSWRDRLYWSALAIHLTPYASIKAAIETEINEKIGEVPLIGPELQSLWNWLLSQFP